MASNKAHTIAQLIEKANSISNVEIEYRLHENKGPIAARSLPPPSAALVSAKPSNVQAAGRERAPRSLGGRGSTGDGAGRAPRPSLPRLFDMLAYLRIDYHNKDIPYITSESVIYTDNQYRYILIDNGERLSAITQQKIPIDFIYSQPDAVLAGISYKLSLSQEINIDKTSIKTVYASNVLNADLAKARNHLAEYENARWKNSARFLVFGLVDDIEDAMTRITQKTSVIYVDFAAHMHKHIKKDPTAQYVCIEDIETLNTTADIVIDNNFVLNYCNKDEHYMHKILNWIYKALVENGQYCCIRFAVDVDAYHAVSDLYPARRLLYSKLYIDDYMLKLLMYRYGAYQASGCRYNSARIDYFKKCDAATLLKNISVYEKSMFVRHKTTYAFIKDNYTIELSRIFASDTFDKCICKGPFATTAEPISHEIELEFIGAPKNVTEALQPINFIKSYTGSPRALGAPDTGSNMMQLVHNIVRKENRPINLTKKNMPNLSQYAITNKTNGTRYYLMHMNDDAVYLVGGSGAARAVGAERPGGRVAPSAAARRLPRSVLDGELVNNVYHVIDCVLHEGAPIMHKPLMERQALASKFVSAHQANIKDFKIVPKVYHWRGPVYKRIISAFEHVHKQCAIENDGLIFASLGAYNNSIFKYKYDLDYLTIDFRLIPDERADQFICCVYSDKEEPFNYTDVFGVPQVAKAYSRFGAPNVVRNMVCECRYDVERSMFEAIRIRNDKTRPNHVSVAQSIWRELTEDLITPAELLQIVESDRSHAALRFYNNGIKRDLICKYARGSILDIGSGVGGDISKYMSSARVSDITLCEPDSSKMDELKRRISVCKGQGAERRATIVHQVTAQNIKLNRRFDTIGAFFMLSFMYESEALLDKFVSVIDTHLNMNGYFIGTLMDGVPERPNPEDGEETDDSDDIQVTPLDPIDQKSKFRYGARISVKFKDCLDQVEYLASFDELRAKLEKRGIKLIDSMKFEPREYLTDHENYFTRANRYFVFKKTKISAVPYIDKNLLIKNLTFEDVKPIAIDIINMHSDNLGVDEYAARRIREGEYKLYQLYDIPTLNMPEIESGILKVYRDRMRNEPMFLLWHWCVKECKNAKVYYIDDTSKLATSITICSAYQWVDLYLGGGSNLGA